MIKNQFFEFCNLQHVAIQPYGRATRRLSLIAMIADNSHFINICIFFGLTDKKIMYFFNIVITCFLFESEGKLNIQDFHYVHFAEGFLRNVRVNESCCTM